MRVCICVGECEIRYEIRSHVKAKSYLFPTFCAFKHTFVRIQSPSDDRNISCLLLLLLSPSFPTTRWLDSVRWCVCECEWVQVQLLQITYCVVLLTANEDERVVEHTHTHTRRTRTIFKGFPYDLFVSFRSTSANVVPVVLFIPTRAHTMHNMCACVSHWTITNTFYAVRSWCELHKAHTAHVRSANSSLVRSFVLSFHLLFTRLFSLSNHFPFFLLQYKLSSSSCVWLQTWVCAERQRCV